MWPFFPGITSPLLLKSNMIFKTYKRHTKLFKTTYIFDLLELDERCAFNILITWCPK